MSNVPPHWQIVDKQSANRADGLKIVYIWNRDTQQYDVAVRHTVLKGDPIPLTDKNRMSYEGAAAEVDQRFPLPDWWTTATTVDRPVADGMSRPPDHWVWRTQPMMGLHHLRGADRIDGVQVRFNVILAETELELDNSREPISTCCAIARIPALDRVIPLRVAALPIAALHHADQMLPLASWYDQFKKATP